MIMLTVGGAIESTIGVAFCLSSLAAAGLGQMVSDSAGITLQGLIERFADSLQLPDPQFSSEQSKLDLVHTVSQVSRTVGIAVGCFVGMFPLLFIETNRSQVSMRDKLLQVL